MAVVVYAVYSRVMYLRAEKIECKGKSPRVKVYSKRNVLTVCRDGGYTHTNVSDIFIEMLKKMLIALRFYKQYVSL